MPKLEAINNDQNTPSSQPAGAVKKPIHQVFFIFTNNYTI